jgi:hypothetical protein
MSKQSQQIEERFRQRQRDAMDAREKERNERSKDLHPNHPDQN